MVNTATSIKSRAIKILGFVEFKLTRTQFESLIGILQYFMATCEIDLLEDRATAFRAYKLYDSKVKTKIFGTTPRLKMKLNISECDTLRLALETVGQRGIYEENLINLILSNIDQQTV